jgi:parvulin-like peptidyl-prolyl isomerase
MLRMHTEEQQEKQAPAEEAMDAMKSTDPQDDSCCDGKHDHNSAPAPIKRLLAAFAGSVLVVLIIGAIASYFFVKQGVNNLSASNFVLTGSKVFGIDAAEINDTRISYAEYRDQQRAISQYVDWTEEDEFAEVTDPEQQLEALTNQSLVMTVSRAFAHQVADYFDVELTEEELADARTMALQQLSEEDVANAFGWDFETYVQKMIVPSLLQQKVAARVFDMSVEEAMTDYGFTEEHIGEPERRASHILFQVPEEASAYERNQAKAEAEAVLARALAGESFEALAQEFGDDGTAEVGGDLGWFARDRMVPAFGTAVFEATEPMILPELIESQFGYHIVRVDELDRRVPNFVTFTQAMFDDAEIEVFLPINDPFAIPEPSEEEMMEAAPVDAEMQVDAEPVQ